MNKPLLSVILVNWNTCNLTIQCIKSIFKDSYDIDIEVIVSDNASVDGSADLISKLFPHVNIIRNSENLGFAKGNNVALQQSKGKYICLVNTDVEIIPGCFAELIKTIESNPKIGIAGPQAMHADKTVQVTARKETSYLNTLARIFWLDTLFPFLNWHSQKKIEEVEVLSGCFWLIRKDALNEVGLLDENFFFYGEDRDYCKRVRNAGWKLVYNPAAKIFHYEGGSSKVKPFHYYLQLEKAYLQYWEKYHSGLSVSLYYLLRILYHVLRFTINAVLCIFSLRKNTMRKQKALRSWYCIWMLTGSKELPGISVQPIE